MSLSRSDSVAAVIVTHNRVELLEASLRMVAGQRALPSEGASGEQRGASESKNPAPNIDHIVVVDNGADERVKALVEQVCGGRGVYLASKTNLGGAGGFAYGFLTALALGLEVGAMVVLPQPT